VHPLSGKGGDSREELQQRDPEAYAFVEGLVAEMTRAMEGDPVALASNRAQLYVELARRALRRADGHADPGRAAALLDSALVHDPGYLPAMVAYAAVEGARLGPASAETWLRNAEGIDPEYAPIHVLRSRLLARSELSLPGTLDTRIAHLERAATVEREPWLRGQI